MGTHPANDARRAHGARARAHDYWCDGRASGGCLVLQSLSSRKVCPSPPPPTIAPRLPLYPTPTPPRRARAPADKWSPYEIALFESALCLVGKHFSHVSGVVKTKTTAECIEFYYLWKKSAHYSTWKENYRQTFGDVE